MTSNPSPEEQLRAENAELRARLEEAEDTLRAIRSGEVEALVVETADGPQIFTLQGLDAESNRFRGEILAQVSDAVIAVDADQRVTYLNAAAEQRYRVPARDALGRQLSDIYTRRWPHAETEAAMWSALREHGEWRGEIIHRTHDGREIAVEKSVTALRDASGTPAGYVGVFRDITERTRAEDAPRESEHRFRIMADGLPLMIWVHDAQGQLQFVNQTYCEFFGVTPQQVFGPNWHPLVHSEDLAAYEGEFSACVRDRRPFHAEVRVRTFDGEWRWIESRARPRFSASGEFLGMVGSSPDITERKRAEAQLQQYAADLSDADRRKDEFLATLAHELRNPLAPLRNGLHLLKVAGGHAATFEQTRTMMERQIAQMVRLLDDLMDVNRINRGKMHLRKERLPFAAVINSAVEASQPLMEQMGHELTVTLPGQPLMVDADMTRLAQVFLNLLNNAAKYSDREGHIQLNVERQGNDAVVTVKDTGLGIAADDLPRIFEMFTQLVRTLEKSQSGLGIGLTLVKRLVEMHGGSIEAKSEGPGKGSEFVVRLPIVVEATAPKGPSGEEEKPARSSLRILVVDDNREGADSLSMVLRVMGNDARTAYDGQEAVHVAGEFLPDVILLDIGLPKLNGYETCRRIRAQSGHKGVILIAVTGWGQDEDHRRSHAAGFDHHMVKPVDPKVLMNKLATLQTAKT